MEHKKTTMYTHYKIVEVLKNIVQYKYGRVGQEGVNM